MGLVGPKARLKGVTDGQLVNIPVLQGDRQRVIIDSFVGLCFSPFCTRNRVQDGEKYVYEEGYFHPRSGVTEREYRSVRID